MRNLKKLATPFLFALVMGFPMAADKPKAEDAQVMSEDAYQWLEDVNGGPAMAWVRACNAASTLEMRQTKGFDDMQKGIKAILDSRDRIAFVGKRGDHYYNFWTDAKNPRGLWRRTTLEEYKKPEPKWDVLLDLDALNKAENTTWVWKGSTILKEGGYRHALVSLSRGGADAVVVREFDLETRQFVRDGFELPEAKGGMDWIDKDTVYVQTDFGPGSLTTSGYPRIAKIWKRGTPLSEAKVVFEGKDTDMSVGAFFDDTKGFERHFVTRTPAFFKSELFWKNPKGELQKVEVPEDAEAYAHKEWLMVTLRTPWKVGKKTYAAGSLLAANFDDFMKGKRNLTVIFEPTERTSLAGESWTKNYLILNVMEDVKNTLYVLKPGKGAWTREKLKGAPQNAQVGASGLDDEESDEIFMTVTDFLTPSSLYYGQVGKDLEKLKSMPAFFDASDLEVHQHFATSKDGTKVPYFQVSKKGITLDGTHPTLLYGYGGFEVPLTPGYSAVSGRAWLEKGGVYVMANIRGGGEYGPRWHQAALREKRHRAYEDFAAIAQDLFARKVTSATHLGAMGGSNGGLLMGNMITLYPELFKAIVCQVPLLDMKRYHKLLAGASWMAEYGDPDKAEEWAFIKTFSPYHNLKKASKYPSVFFTTSTRDDRVHPAHARKMMALMQEMGCDVRYFENIEGGHGGSADNSQRAFMTAMSYAFLWNELK